LEKQLRGMCCHYLRPFVPEPILLFFPNIHTNAKVLLLTMLQGKTRATAAQNSGTDTEDESSVISPNEPTSTAMGVSASQPLSAIAERTVSGADESDEDEEDVAGGWRPANAAIAGGNSTTDLHSGYLWKKGSGRRKVGLQMLPLYASVTTLLDLEKAVVCS
jgi:hypothetical protein